MQDDWDEDSIDDDWAEDDDEADLARCPNCGADVYEDAEQCPSCGDYIVHRTSVWEDKPTWWILLGLAGIAAVVYFFSGLAR